MQRLSIDKSTFSRFFSSAIESHTNSRYFVAAQNTKFTNFQSTAIYLNKAEEKLKSNVKTYTSTYQVENSTLSLRLCYFDKCYTNSNDGAAISFEAEISTAELVHCNFYMCITIGYSGGAINVPNFEKMNISMCCFGMCYSNNQSHIINAISNKKPFVITDTTFGESGKKSVPSLNYFHRTDLLYSQTNTTYNLASDGVHFTVSKPYQIILKNCFWVYNEGETCFLHPESVDAKKLETWEYNNVFYNSIKTNIIKGSIDATISNFVMAGNTFRFFWGVDLGSTIHLTGGIFDFGQAKLHNSEGFDSRIEFRQDTKFEVVGITPLKINVSKNNYCYRIKVRQPFTKGGNAIIRLQSVDFSNHPHITILIALLFVGIVLLGYYFLLRKAETRQGLMRNI